MAVAVGDIWTFALEMKLYQQQVYNTFAMQVTAVPGGTTEATFVDTWFSSGSYFNSTVANFLLAHKTCCSTDLAYVQWHVTRVNPNPTQPFIRTVTAGTTGSQLSPAGNANSAASISRVGSSAGRRYRGRIAVPGIPQLEQQSGKWASTTMTRLTVLGALIIGSATGATGFTSTLGYYSPAHTEIKNGQPVNLPALYVNAVNAVARDTVRVQRSRTVGVGS